MSEADHAAAPADNNSKALAVREKRSPSVLDWDEEYRRLVKLTVLKPKDREASGAELAMFAEQVQRTGLDPFFKQIYGIFRFDKRAGREVMQVQAGIDGFRLIAERTGKYEGQTPAMWCGEDGLWSDVWTKPGNPFAARVGVYKKGRREPTYAVAHWREYVQTYSGKPSGKWADMPANQLAKCFSEDTEILTTHGFQPFGAVTGAVLQVTDAGLVPCDARPFVQPWDGPMVVLDSDDLNFAVTPNHDMLIVDLKVEREVRMEAGDLYERASTRREFAIPRSVHGTRPDTPISDDLLTLAAAYVADGYDGPHGTFKVAVSRPRKVAQLDALGLHRSHSMRAPAAATGLSGRVVTATAKRGIYTYDVALVADLVTPGKVVNVGTLIALSRRQARVFVDALIGFDGHTQKRTGVRRFYTSRLDHLAAFEVACVAAGYAVSVRRSRMSDLSRRPNWYITVSDRDAITFRRWGKSHSVSKGNAAGRTGLEARPNASGRVWCVTVPSGEIIVRRNGFSMRCGNCAEALALRKCFPAELSGLYTPEEMAQADNDHSSLAQGVGDGQPIGLVLGPEVENVLERAAALGHAQLADRATTEMVLDGQPPEKVAAWVEAAHRELDAIPVDAVVVEPEPQRPAERPQAPKATRGKGRSRNAPQEPPTTPDAAESQPDPEHIEALRRRALELLDVADGMDADGDPRAGEVRQEAEQIMTEVEAASDVSQERFAL